MGYRQSEFCVQSQAVMSIYTSVTVKNFIVCAIEWTLQADHSSKELYFLSWNERMQVSGFASKELYCLRTDVVHRQ